MNVTQMIMEFLDEMSDYLFPKKDYIPELHKYKYFGGYMF
jgi:hypothetical protein